MGEDQSSFASYRSSKRRSLANDTSARVPFAFIAVLIMIMASFSAAYLSSVNKNEILSHIENLEIQKMDEIGRAHV